MFKPFKPSSKAIDRRTLLGPTPPPEFRLCGLCVPLPTASRALAPWIAQQPHAYDRWFQTYSLVLGLALHVHGPHVARPQSVM